MNSKRIAVNLAVVGVIVVVGWIVMSAAVGAQEGYVEESAEWCDEHNGTLVNQLGFGSSGGLHCDLPNGTTVKMANVIDTSEGSRR